MYQDWSGNRLLAVIPHFLHIAEKCQIGFDSFTNLGKKEYGHYKTNMVRMAQSRQTQYMYQIFHFLIISRSVACFPYVRSISLVTLCTELDGWRTLGAGACFGGRYT